jgi:hypothetical protein
MLHETPEGAQARAELWEKVMAASGGAAPEAQLAGAGSAEGGGSAPPATSSTVLDEVE